MPCGHIGSRHLFSPTRPPRENNCLSLPLLRSTRSFCSRTCAKPLVWSQEHRHSRTRAATPLRLASLPGRKAPFAAAARRRLRSLEFMPVLAVISRCRLHLSRFLAHVLLHHCLGRSCVLLVSLVAVIPGLSLRVFPASVVWRMPETATPSG